MDIEIKEYGGKRPKSPFPVWASFLLTKGWRDKRINRSAVIKAAEIRAEDIVLELGCGPGFYTEILAERVEGGKVIAQDIQKPMLEQLRKRADDFNRTDNIELLLADSSSTGLADASIDKVFAANVFEEICKESGMEAAAMEAFRVLKPGGTLFVGEHRMLKTTLNKIMSALEATGMAGRKISAPSFYYSALFTKE